MKGPLSFSVPHCITDTDLTAKLILSILLQLGKYIHKTQMGEYDTLKKFKTDIWVTHFLKILWVRKDFFRTIYNFSAFPLTTFPGVLMDVRQKKQERIPRDSWCPPSLPGSRSWRQPGWQIQGSRGKEISSHLNSKVFSLWLAKYTFCPAHSTSSLPSRLTSGPKNIQLQHLRQLKMWTLTGLFGYKKIMFLGTVMLFFKGVLIF